MVAWSVNTCLIVEIYELMKLQAYLIEDSKGSTMNQALASLKKNKGLESSTRDGAISSMHLGKANLLSNLK
jgi:hypothetical protein